MAYKNQLSGFHKMANRHNAVLAGNIFAMDGHSVHKEMQKAKNNNSTVLQKPTWRSVLT
jgi:hypothetical protein